MDGVPEQGDLYRLVLEGMGHEQQGPRYGVVVSDQPFNQRTTVVIVPFSSSTWDDELHPTTVVNGRRTRAMVEQVRAVDKRRLREKIGSVAGETVMDLIREQLIYLFALDE